MVSLKKKFGYEMGESELEGYVRREEDQVISKLKKSLRPCHGVDTELAKLESHGKYHLAVVSSSALRRVQASISKVGQDRYFAGEHVFSAATSLEKPTSKPDPAIYLHAMKVLGKKAQECVAVEDSRSGATAAFRAGIKTVGYVGSYEVEEQGRMREVLRGSGCCVVMGDWKEFEGCLDGIERGEF